MMGPRKAVFLDRDGVINKAVVLQGKPNASSLPSIQLRQSHNEP